MSILATALNLGANITAKRVEDYSAVLIELIAYRESQTHAACHRSSGRVNRPHGLIRYSQGTVEQHVEVRNTNGIQTKTYQIISRRRAALTVQDISRYSPQTSVASIPSVRWGLSH